MEKHFFKKFIFLITASFFAMTNLAQAGENVDVSFGADFPIMENNLLPGDVIKREITVTNKTELTQQIMMRFERTSTPGLYKIEDKILVSIKKISDGSFLILPFETLSELYDYSNPDGTIGNAFSIDTIAGGVDNFEKYELIFTFDPNTGNDWQKKETIFNLSVGIDARPAVAPVAKDDSEKTDQGDDATIDILDNDTDSDGTIDPTTVAIVNNPDHGDIDSVNSTTGKIKYDPDNDYFGDDEFTYTVKDNDGNISNVATVKIKIIENKADEETAGRVGGLVRGTQNFFQNLLNLPAEGAQETVPEGGTQVGENNDELETGVAGAEDTCQSWPWWVWAISLAVFGGFFSYNDLGNYNKAKYGWKIGLGIALSAILFWWYFDKCREYQWFLYGSNIGAIGIHSIFIYFLRKKLKI